MTAPSQVKVAEAAPKSGFYLPFPVENRTSQARFVRPFGRGRAAAAGRCPSPGGPDGAAAAQPVGAS